MFEGFVSQVLAGYLGRYVKGIQKDQLRIGIWSEEVLLENVELILEAFDYLQLPFALKQGKIGKLSIKIPWKKLGWDPIVIQLEDVFICACSRDKDDWSLDTVKKRELAGKMSKLNAAELAKFSKRFYGNQVGQYVFAKILDNIQVSVKNVHIVYVATQADPEKFIFGLRFSSLTIMTDSRKQSSSGLSYGKFQAGQVKKILKISTFGVYCNLLDDIMSTDGDPVVTLSNDSKFDLKRYDYLINPFDLTIYLLVNKSGMFNTSPEYSIVAELSSVVMLLNDAQLHQILSLWDHLSICFLRERYGCYRPDNALEIKKVGHWQILWWHYAQQSVLADVRRRLRKTSWSSFGKRISQRHKYVNLYRLKLELIQQNQHVREEILEELEQMDRECDIDEILSYRSRAENQLQELMLHNKDAGMGESESISSADKALNDEKSFTRLRGWLNWLSLGMLGAGGTADSSSFAGVVSDEIIKDIFEATDPHQLSDYTGNENYEGNMIFSSLIKFDIDHFTMTLSSKKQQIKDIALMFLDGVGVECKISEESMAVTLSIKSAMVTNPVNDNNLLTSEKKTDDDDFLARTPCFCANIIAPPSGRTFNFSIKVVLQGIDIAHDLDFLKNFAEFVSALEDLQFHSQRVMLSLNGFSNVNARVLAKAEHIFMSRKKIIWDVNATDINITVPQTFDDSDCHAVVINLGVLHLKTKPKEKSDSTLIRDNEYNHGSLTNMPLAYNLPSDFKIEDLYEHLEIDLSNLKANIVSADSNTFPVFGEFNATVILSLCIFLDGPALKQFDASWSISSVESHISPQLLNVLSQLWSKTEEKIIKKHDESNVSPVTHSSSLNFSWCSVSIQLDRFKCNIDLDGDPDQSSVISVYLNRSSVGFTLHDSVGFSFSLDSMKIWWHFENTEASYILCSSKNREYFLNQSEDVHTEELTDKCIVLYYHAFKNDSRANAKCTIELSGFDFHIHPRFLGFALASYSRAVVGLQNSGYNSSSLVFDKTIDDSLVSDSYSISGSAISLTVDLILREIRAHFHDSSSVLATLTFPSVEVSHLSNGVDFWEATCLLDGLNLSSTWSNASWSSPNISDVLWGSCSPLVTPTLNIHVKRFRDKAGFRVMKTNAKLNHVKFILMPEFVAMIIGYFSLPDWIPQKKEINVTEEEYLSHVYKFEIHDSFLFLPVENKAFSFLLSLPKLTGSFNMGFHSSEAPMSLPVGFSIHLEEMTDIFHLVNISVRGSSLRITNCDHFLSGSIPEQDYGAKNLEFLPNIDADIWLIIPLDVESAAPTSILLNSDNCTLMIEDEWFLQGMEAVSACVTELSNIIDDSLNFTSDARHYIQLRKKLKETHAVSSISPPIPFDISICANCVSLKLVQSASSDVIATMKSKIALSAVFRNDILTKLDADIMHLSMHSSLHSVVLLSFLPENSSTCMSISFSESNIGGSLFQFSIPSLDIWLHFLDWNKIIDFLNAFGRLSDSPDSEPRNNHEVDLIVKFDKIMISLHLPSSQLAKKIDMDRKESPDLGKNIVGENAPSSIVDLLYLTFTLRTRDTVLTLNNKGRTLKLSAGRIKMIIKLTGDQGLDSTPVIQFFLGKMSAEIYEESQEVLAAISDVNVETLSMNLIQEVVRILQQIEVKSSGTSNLPTTLHSIFFHVQLAKLSFLLSDQMIQSSGSIFEITCKNTIMDGKISTKFTAESHLSVNYKNFQKAMWEPFIEPWSFCLKVTQNVNNGSRNGAETTEIFLSSLHELNFNVTESLVEAILLVQRKLNETSTMKDSNAHKTFGHLISEANQTALKNNAPYIIFNETSLPLSIWVFNGPSTTESVQMNILQPGCSFPMYLEEPQEVNLPKKAAYSSERLLERKLNAISHHYISVQLHGTSTPSNPMSMDLVGISYFDVNFSNPRASDDETFFSSRGNESYFRDPSSGLVVPVVLDVSMHFYCKVIRFYSTVLLLNATSRNLELRFDIPFSVSPKIFGPILPGQEFPLPVHLAEAVGMRWRPVDSDYFWSEAHSLSKILSDENRLGFMKSVVCYPSRPKSDPFRCCMSVEDRFTVYPNGAKEGSSLHINSTSEKIELNAQEIHDHGKSKKVFIRRVRLTTPLVVKNNLPSPLAVTIDSAGVVTSISLSEVDAASIFHIDSTHDLDMTFNLEAYNHVVSKFPRAETFSVFAKRREAKYLTSDTLTFYPNEQSANILGPVCVKVDKTMDINCGAREISISVPFLLYNCTGLSLGIVDDDLQQKGHPHFIPSCFSLMSDEDLSFKSRGISLLTSEDMKSTQLHLLKKYKPNYITSEKKDLPEASCISIKKSVHDGSRASLPSLSENIIDMENERDVKPFMYSPPGHLSENDLVVRLQKYSLQQNATSSWNNTWSSPFSLIPESGSTSIVIPRPGGSGAFLVSVTSSQVNGELSKISRGVIFQPRYVICNACSKHLCFKQKGTSDSHSVRLNVGQHSHLHWTDITRDLLVCIRFDERGGQWSGSFLPDFLGDTQVKVRNHVTGTSDMVRVEIQNAGMLANQTKYVDISNGNSGTYLILLSDDDSGFMPYRIDNFSMENLRIYQQKCETSEITLRAYASCQYAWDEPFCPRRLVVEMPGEHLLGTYNLDDVKEYPPVSLPSSSRKPETRFFIAVRAEGATKVLSIVDSRYHTLRDIRDVDSSAKEGKTKQSHQVEKNINFSEKIVLHLPVIGISLINSSPQEIIYVSAKETTVIFMQNADKQRVSFEISSLQIDNQLPDTPYPILLSFGQMNRENILRREIDDLMMPSAMEDAHEADIYFSASKWRKESAFVSFENISARLAPISLELEELVLLQILAFLRNASSKFENEHFQYSKFCAVDHNQREKRPSYNSVQKKTESLPVVVPFGAPWQRIRLPAGHQKRIYIETFQLAPVKLIVSFSSNPWLMQKEDILEAGSLPFIRSAAFQRGFMALVDVEGVPFHLKELVLTNFMASRESVREIVSKHYTKQLLHEIYKIFGSAGLIGNPMGFARNVGMGFRDFLSVSSKDILQSPAGLITGVAQGSKSLLGNTIYAMSSATSQFSKAAQKGIVAFTFDEQVAGKIEKQKSGHDSQAKGILNEFFEGLTGLLQSPIRGAEKHGLPGVLSGIALGTAGLVARPVVSLLETTEKAAQTIKKMSSPHQSKRFRTRLPRPMARDLPLSPYSWEEAAGVSMLQEADNSRLKDEIFIKCRALKQDRKFIIITERLVLVVNSDALIGLGRPGFQGVADVIWVVETEMPINSIIHMEREATKVNIIGSEVDNLKQKRNERLGLFDLSASVLLCQMSAEFSDEEAAEDVLQMLGSVKEQGDFQSRSSMKVIHRSCLR